MFDFNVQRVLHFSQSLHRFTGIEKRIAFERGKEGKRKGEGEQARQLNRAQVSGSCMQSHSAKTPSMCELCHMSNAPTFLSGASIRAGRRELPGVSAGNCMAVPTPQPTRLISFLQNTGTISTNYTEKGKGTNIFESGFVSSGNHGATHLPGSALTLLCSLAAAGSRSPEESTFGLVQSGRPFVLVVFEPRAL